MHLGQIQQKHPRHLHIALRRERVQSQTLQRRLRDQPPNPTPQVLGPLHVNRARPDGELFEAGNRGRDGVEVAGVIVKAGAEVLCVEVFEVRQEGENFWDRGAWCSFETEASEVGKLGED